MHQLQVDSLLGIICKGNSYLRHTMVRLSSKAHYTTTYENNAKMQMIKKICIFNWFLVN